MTLAEKAKKLIKQRAFLFKLLLTILGFICIPLMAMQIFVIGQSTDEFQKSNEEYYLSVLQSTANTFASRERVLSQTALRISLNETVQKPLRHTATEYSLLEAVQALDNYGAEVLHVDNAGMYYITEGYLLTNGIKYTLEDYCQKFEPDDPKIAKKMQAFFNSVESMDYYATSDGRTLFVARPVSLGAVGRNDAICFFATDAQELEASYRAAVSLHASVAILDEQGEYLIRGGDFSREIGEAEMKQFLSGRANVCAVGNEQELLLYRYTDPESDFVFLLSVDKDESEKHLLDFAVLVRGVMWGMIVLMTASLAVTIYINYRPIHRLIEKHTPATVDRGDHSELERLDSAFFTLDERMSTQRNLLMDFILGDLLFGNAVKPELLNQYFPAGRYRCFMVLTALCPAFSTGQARQLSDRIKEVSKHDIHITRVPSRPHAVFICLGRTLIDPEGMRRSVSQALEEILGEDCQVDAGEVVEEIGLLRASYRSAVTANITVAQEEPNVVAGDFTKRIQAFSQCVYMGDEPEARKQLEEIKRFLFHTVSGAGHRRYYGYKLLNSYVTAINGNEAHLSSQDVELLFSFNNLEHLFNLLEESLHQICGQVADSERTVDLQLQQRLLQYVDDNFRNSELCLTSTADYMDTSIYAISRLFKEVTGRGFKDYVTEKRLEYGHMLLCTTQQSVAEVAAAAGFENANYFSTVFKVKYGLPPTKYRRIQKEKQAE